MVRFNRRTDVWQFLFAVGERALCRWQVLFCVVDLFAEGDKLLRDGHRAEAGDEVVLLSPCFTIVYLKGLECGEVGEMFGDLFPFFVFDVEVSSGEFLGCVA